MTLCTVPNDEIGGKWKKRQEKYKEYIQQTRQKIASEMKIQRQILIDNYLPLDFTKNIIGTA